MKSEFIKGPVLTIAFVNAYKDQDIGQMTAKGKASKRYLKQMQCLNEIKAIWLGF